MPKLTVSASSLENLVVRNAAEKNTFFSDATTKDGGEGSFASPKELFLSSVASCKIMTVLLYAKRKAWVVEDVKIHLEMDTAYNEGGYTIYQNIEILSNLDKVQENRLKEIADRCPVAHYMKSGVTFANSK